MQDLRSSRRRRRLGDVVWGDLAYRVYTTALACLVLTVFASGLVGDATLGPGAVDDVLANGPAWAGLVLSLGIFFGVRSGLRSGPLALEAPDVHHLLLAPVDRSAVLRRPATSMMGYGVAAIALAGALVGELLGQRLPGSRAGWLFTGLLFGAVTTALSMGAAMITASRRVSRWVLPVVAVALVAWSVLDVFDVAVAGPSTRLGTMLFWPLQFGAEPIPGIVLAVVVAVVGVAVVGGLSLEAARRRTQLVGQLRFAVTQQDLRSVLLLRRQLASERPRNRSRWQRLPAVLGRAAPVFTRDLQSLLRWPTVRILRVVVLVVGAGLALRGAYSGTTPLVLAAGLLLYVAALDAIEPLAQEVDHPTMLSSYPIPSGIVLVRHLVAPVVVLVFVGALGVAVAWAVAPDAQVLSVGAITAVSAAFAGVAGAAISVVSEVVVDQSDGALFTPEVAGPRVVVRTLWPPLVAVIGCSPVLLAQRAARSGAEQLPVALAGAGFAVALSAAVFTWVRYRDDLHRSMSAAMRGETP